MTIVKKIILANIIVFGVCSLFNFYGLHLENLFALYPIGDSHFSGYQIITHIFIHGNLEHLFYNMLFLLLTGPDVEKYFGNKFLSFYLLSGIFSSGLYFLGSDEPVIGASGAVSSIIAVWVLSTIKDKKFQIHWSLKLKSIFFISIILSEVFFALTSYSDHVAHLAHVFGVIFGVFYYLRFDHSQA